VGAFLRGVRLAAKQRRHLNVVFTEVPFFFFFLFFLLEEREIAVAESEFPSQVYLIKGSSSSEEGGLVERGRMEREGDKGRGKGGLISSPECCAKGFLCFCFLSEFRLD
jgi:hypothetical protein